MRRAPELLMPKQKYSTGKNRNGRETVVGFRQNGAMRVKPRNIILKEKTAGPFRPGGFILWKVASAFKY